MKVLLFMVTQPILCHTRHCLHNLKYENASLDDHFVIHRLTAINPSRLSVNYFLKYYKVLNPTTKPILPSAFSE